MALANQHISLTLPGVQDLIVEQVNGREAISRLYEFEVSFLARDRLDLDTLIGAAATLEITVYQEKKKIDGLVLAATALDPTHGLEYHPYRLRIGPEMAMLAYTSQTTVHGSDEAVTVVDLIGRLLDDGQVKVAPSIFYDRPRRAGGNFTIAVDGSQYPKYDFLLQYRESDLNFLSRHCETHGVFYFFTREEGKEKIVFGDQRAHFKPAQGEEGSVELDYFPGHYKGIAPDFAVSSWTAHRQAMTGVFHARGYNELTPGVDLALSEASNLPGQGGFQGQGVAVEYGLNYRDENEGKFFLRRRAERAECEGLRFHGKSNMPLLRPGHTFRLKNHPEAGMDGEYLVIEVRHGLTSPAAVAYADGPRAAAAYHNDFTAIPSAREFRPACLTPKPVVHGFLLARIDGNDGGHRANIDDDLGRYKIRLMEEESTLGEGKASHWVRKMQPYGGGDGIGWHFPLLKGTEILVGFLHGDPDRPLIMGALDNMEANSPVRARNGVINRWVTAGGIIQEASCGTL